MYIIEYNCLYEVKRMNKNKWIRQISIIKSSGIDYAQVSLPVEVFKLWRNDYQNVKMVYDDVENSLKITPV
jgi:hypothetical protein